MTIRRHIAPVRFGLGLRLGEAPPADPEAWLERQIRNPGPPPPGITAEQAVMAWAVHLMLRDEMQPQSSPRAQATRAALELRGLPVPERSPFPDIIRREGLAWGTRRLGSEDPFRDRLVDFWANHFSTARRGGRMGILPAAMETDAIRPHVTGRFADMLVAATRHPAMLTYLDNVTSVGPESPAGRGRRRGLNENLAREVLELHTLSPAGAFTQGDVQALAMILTGWVVTADPENGFGFAWRPQAHQPGPKTLLGQRFEEGPESQEAALRFLASRPATFRHLAVKLARHFVADDPPPEAIRALEEVLRRTDGDLAEVSLALVRLPQAWDPPLGKVRSPADYAIAAGRALGFGADRAEQVLAGMAAANQPLWMAPQPNGWPDTAAGWATPEGLMRRVDWAYTLAGRAAVTDLAGVAEAALGPLARAETVTAMRRAGSLRDAVTLMLGSPEFMQR